MTNFVDNINILDTVFGIKRIVDAKKKRIINLDSNSNIKIDAHSCFEFWKNGSVCSNCISMRALHENKSFSKFETVDNKLYMIIASPININNDRYVVELIKDVSNDTISSSFNSLIQKELEDEIRRLNKLVVTDELTSIYNRRYINEQLPYSIDKLSYTLSSLSIILIDVNKFKFINDEYGHIYGDYVLRDISFIFNKFANKNNGWVARYGGDEFIMVFENMSSESTYEACNILKQLITEAKFLYNDINIEVSCSFGFSVLEDSNINIEKLIRDIDDKLFLDKKCI